MAKLQIGSKAYLDTFSGLIACKVISIETTPAAFRLGLSNVRVKVQLTTSRAAYKRGEIIESSANWVVPRECIYTRSGIKKIAPYSV